jgi:hypothetical protein
MTRCTIVSGASTSFWLDKWLPGECLAVRFPALFSHVTRPHATVEVVLGSGFDLQPRLSQAAAVDLAAVRDIVASVSLRPGCDARAIDAPSAPAFSSREAYRALTPSGPRVESACLAWDCRLPTKLKIFAYLANIDRLSSRANLRFKNCSPTDVCAACPGVETGRHIFFDCAVAAGVWARLGVSAPAGDFSFWTLQAPGGLSLPAWRCGIVTLLWCIWKARNDLVFNSRHSSPADVIRRACDDLLIWRWRFPSSDRVAVDLLRSFLLSCNV